MILTVNTVQLKKKMKPFKVLGSSDLATHLEDLHIPRLFMVKK